MSKLEDLINELCHNGVKYKNLGDISNIKTGKGLTKKDCIENGNYAIISGGIMPLGYCNVKNRDRNTVTIARAGTAGYVNYIEEDFYLNDKCFSVIPNEKYYNIINTKFLYYYLKNIEQEIMGLKSEGSVPTVNTEKVSRIKVAVPPLEVQCEIVHILDNFTLLSAELSAELKARQKQYEYYRDELLNNNHNELVSLKSITKRSCSGGTPLKSNTEYYKNGNVPWLRTQDVRFNEINEITSFISEKAVKETSVKWIPENCVIIAISGASAGRCAINKIKTTTNQHCLNIEVDSSKALYKYVFYCVHSKYNELLSMKQGARGDLNSTKILSLKIPLPTLEKQEKIVSILERFDKLCNDISEGLPAEIEARQKQYEYYRDKLLTFKELEVNG